MEDGPAPGMREDAPVPRVVLDTNACLDLFVFRDPRTDVLLAALRSGELMAVTNASCREEWLRVLQYPQLGLDEAGRVAAVAAFDAIVACVDVEALRAAAPPLPRCADPDDQKFLQLARDAGARWLVSRDDALLKLDRRTRRDGLFGIIQPQDWSSATPDADQISNR